ncbi:3'-5' RNA helicase YTHDC2 [Condylostylus longicornis]|uniref:3'-5' RNA helicase YTHDC2 n=1 Tax=Condylostylus longicornis TaxID=2530218 RepID=UPI00244DF612|nr:3'-5' RNA helicase YTHDC2 [Condylostylus longicornis]
MTFPKFFNAMFRQKIILSLKTFSKNSGTIIKWREHEYNGLKFLKIYKPNCNSYLQENLKFEISENSKKEQVELCPGHQKSDISKPRIQIYHFSMNKQNNTITVPPKSKRSTKILPEQHTSIDHYRNKILEKIILENSSKNNEHCRIVYSNNQKFVAIKNSELIAKRRGELLGITTGYQIPLKSVSSCNKTNLLFTSTSYFLRCLMGINSKDVFYGLTHVILDDVQERDFQMDLLLFEIRETLTFYPKLKILLLCSNPYNIKPFEDYFKNIEVLNLPLNFQTDKVPQVYNLSKILKMVNYLTPEMEVYTTSSYENKKVTLEDPQSQLMINNLLDRYINELDAEAFDKFCYLVQEEHIPVDIQHNEHFMNMLMGAAKNDELDHLKILLKLNANVYLQDCNKRNVQDWASISKSTQCLCEIQKVINSKTADEKFPEEMKRLKAYRYTRINNFEVDHLLVFELLKYLHNNVLRGSILIFVPNYDDMLKIQFYLENYFKNKKIESYIILKLHNNSKMSEIDELFKISYSNFKRKFIFATQIAEVFLTLTDILYVVDSGLIKLSNHSIGTSKIQWISKDRAERRKCVAKDVESVCFRLYTVQDLSNFQQVIIPELMHMPLDNVCLFAKVLSPYTTIKEYFMRTISTPSNGQVEKSIQLLKAIGALEEQESITSLGIRLLDIPLPVQLGKVLIYSIFMQCLDPVLTIISILHFNDQFMIPDPGNNNLYLCLGNLAEKSNSDHITFLRLFQKWQDDKLDSIFQPSSLGMFLMDQNLQVICEIRSEIVGIVRSAQLIHATGLLSMNYINSFANNWSMVKASFAAGMYPNICHIEKDHPISDHVETQFKCNNMRCGRKLFLYPGSVLRDVAPDSWNKKSISYQTDWLFYQNAIHREKVCRIHCSTLITPITIALFCGNLKKSDIDLVSEKVTEKDSNQMQNEKTDTLIQMLVDEWISFTIPKVDALLIFHLRQKFSHLFMDLLQNCDNHEKLQRFRHYYTEKLKVLEIISKVLQNEDINVNFPQLERIGERPKALPLSFICGMRIPKEKVSNLIKIDSKNEKTVGESFNSINNTQTKRYELSDIKISNQKSMTEQTTNFRFKRRFENKLQG